jgi:hypothetical protein
MRRMLMTSTRSLLFLRRNVVLADEVNITTKPRRLSRARARTSGSSIRPAASLVPRLHASTGGGGPAGGIGVVCPLCIHEAARLPLRFY